MSNIILKDDMKKESIVWKIPMLFFFALATIFLLWQLVMPEALLPQIKMQDVVLMEAVLLIIAGYFLYAYLYLIKYDLTVTNEKIILKTLFKNVEIELNDIKTYKCKRYNRTKFYRFVVSFRDKKITIDTRYRDELEKILNGKK